VGGGGGWVFWGGVGGGGGGLGAMMIGCVSYGFQYGLEVCGLWVCY